MIDPQIEALRTVALAFVNAVCIAVVVAFVAIIATAIIRWQMLK